MILWVDGKRLPPDTPIATAADRGLSLGDGLFETIKVASGRALFLTEHLARMAVAGRELGLHVDRDKFRAGVHSVLEGAQDGSLRLMITRGDGPRGLMPITPSEQRPRRVIAYYPAHNGDGPKPANIAPGLPMLAPQTPPLDRLLPAPFVRASGAMTSRHKTLSYTDNLAARAFVAEGEAADVVFLNEFGRVASTSMANLFVWTGERYLTPPLTEGILPGIVRDVLLVEGREMGVEIEVTPLTPDDLRDRLLFRTNSLIGVKPAWYDTGGRASPPSAHDDGMLEKLYRLAERREEAR